MTATRLRVAWLLIRLRGVIKYDAKHLDPSKSPKWTGNSRKTFTAVGQDPASVGESLQRLIIYMRLTARLIRPLLLLFVTSCVTKKWLGRNAKLNKSQVICLPPFHISSYIWVNPNESNVGNMKKWKMMLFEYFLPQFV